MNVAATAPVFDKKPLEVKINNANKIYHNIFTYDESLREVGVTVLVISGASTVVAGLSFPYMFVMAGGVLGKVVVGRGARLRVPGVDVTVMVDNVVEEVEVVLL